MLISGRFQPQAAYRMAQMNNGSSIAAPQMTEQTRTDAVTLSGSLFNSTNALRWASAISGVTLIGSIGGFAVGALTGNGSLMAKSFMFGAASMAVGMSAGSQLV